MSEFRTGEIVDGVYDTVLYIAGYPTPAEAEAAVRNVRFKERRAVRGSRRGKLLPATVHSPKPGEVRLLTGAV